jgi:hypothetical protein
MRLMFSKCLWCRVITTDRLAIAEFVGEHSAKASELANPQILQITPIGLNDEN